MQPVRVIKHRNIIQISLLHFIPGLVIPPLHTLLLQAAKEAFHYGIDAPMSSHKSGLFQISQDKRIKLPNNVAL
jgi:hypothetical protein